MAPVLTGLRPVVLPVTQQAAIGLLPMPFLDWVRAALPRGGRGEGMAGAGNRAFMC